MAFATRVAIEDLRDPTAVRFTPADGESSSPRRTAKILVFDSFERRRPDGLRRPPQTGLRQRRPRPARAGARPRLPGPALRLRALHLRPRARRRSRPPGSIPAGARRPSYEGDPCPKPASADVDACPVSGRLVRLTDDLRHQRSRRRKVAGRRLVPAGLLALDRATSAFGPEGALFASGGEGASFISSDYGQFGWPHENQCDDPPGGESLEPPSAEGGSLRSQDAAHPSTRWRPSGPDRPRRHADPDRSRHRRRLAGQPDGDEPGPRTSAGSSPSASAIPSASRSTRAANEVYVDNVGNGTDEEIDRVPLRRRSAYNSGWPCYRRDRTEPRLLRLRARASAKGSTTNRGPPPEPFFYYSHASGVTPGRPLPDRQRLGDHRH